MRCTLLPNLIVNEIGLAIILPLLSDSLVNEENIKNIRDV